MSELIMKSRVKNYRKQIYIDVCKMPFIDEEKNMSETREECKRRPRVQYFWGRQGAQCFWSIKCGEKDGNSRGEDIPAVTGSCGTKRQRHIRVAFSIDDLGDRRRE